MFRGKNEKMTVSNDVYATIRELILNKESVLIYSSWWVIEVTITEIEGWIEFFGEETLIDFSDSVCAHIFDNSDCIYEL